MAVSGLTVWAAACTSAPPPARVAQPQIESREVPVITVDGRQFRDLDRDGGLTPYEDWRLAPDARAADLVARMTLHEKAGTMMHGSLTNAAVADGQAPSAYDLEAVSADVRDRAITSFISRLTVAPAVLAEAHNQLQAIAERTRLGIPLTISTDPRHHFQVVLGASESGEGFSKWPELLGFGALDDADLVRRFADIARQEYRAVGIHQALSPQADLVTEPRWPRGLGTFGSNPDRVSALVGAYVAGFQGGDRGLTRDGVLTVVKHWAGYGAAPGGWDGHNPYGRTARVTDESFALHVKAFAGAFANEVAGVMPTYSIVEGATLDGAPLEAVGAGFNRQLLTTLLRERHHFTGLVLSDWGITNDCPDSCVTPTTPQGPGSFGMPWGVERLTRLERFAKGIAAGIDQFGGVTETDLVEAAVTQGLVTAARLDASVVRILTPKFVLGLFDDPFVAPGAFAAIAGRDEIRRAAREAQAASHVVVKTTGGLLPAAPGTAVYLDGVSADAAKAHGLQVVDDPARAAFAIVRAATPFEQPHPLHFFGRRHHEGRLDFRPGVKDYDTVRSLAARTQVIVALFLDRPAVLGDLDRVAAAILANFGASDDALLDVVTGAVAPRGALPFELPASMAAVEAQDPARPDDSAAPRAAAGTRIPLR